MHPIMISPIKAQNSYLPRPKSTLDRDLKSAANIMQTKSKECKNSLDVCCRVPDNLIGVLPAE